MSTTPKVLIITINQDEQSTEVMEWLIAYGAECIRINTDVTAQNPLTQLTALPINNDTNPVYDAVWIRKPRRQTSPYATKNIQSKPGYQKFIPAIAERHIEKELSDIQAFLLSGMEASRVLGNFDYSEVNKYSILMKARNIGLKIPDTILTNSKKELMAFKAKHEQIISKMNHLLVGSNDEGSEMIHSYTERISNEFIETLADHFFPSSFQKEITKTIEIRSFYLDGQFYSIAMFTQKNPQTTIDSRRYDYTNPIRRVPYQLPPKIEDLLDQLMQSIPLNTASIDLIKGTDGKFYFLELNPVGQFGQTSDVGNYYLPKKVAEFLISKKDTHEK